MRNKDITIVIPLAPGRKVEDVENIKSQGCEIIIEYGKNPSENRNRGIKKAKTEFVAFINGHTSLNSNWAEKVIEFFNEYPDVDIVGGPQYTPKNSGQFERASGYALSSIFGAAIVRKRYFGKEIDLDADETSITSANLICRRKVFKKIKFDESIYPGEDPKFIEDAKKAGFKVAYCPDIIVYNKRRSNLLELAKQIYGYGFARTRKEQLLDTIKKPVFVIPSLFFVYIIILPLLVFIEKSFIIPFLGYIILDLFFSMLESIKNNNLKSLIILIIIFPVIHLSYGFGFLIGILKKLMNNF